MLRRIISALLCIPAALAFLAGCGGSAPAGPISGNINNGGFVEESGGDLYFTNFADEGRLYAVLADGTQKKISDDRAYGIQRVGEWIYYKDRNTGSLYRLMPDGSEKQRLGEDAATFPQVWDGWIYYINPNDSQAIYRVKTDGTGAEKLHDGICSYLNVTPQGIYYANPAEGNSLYFLNHDGTGQALVLLQFCAQLNVAGSWAYYIDLNGRVCRAPLDGQGEPEPLAEGAGNFLVVAGRRIAFVKDGAVWRMDTDGKNPLKLTEEENVQNLFIAGDNVYYHSAGAGNLVRVGMDGKGVREFP